ncbi:hypothetical protein PFISCL1PPCAC_26976, partial [Pristionchus fissidentatus]
PDTSSYIDRHSSSMRSVGSNNSMSYVSPAPTRRNNQPAASLRQNTTSNSSNSTSATNQYVTSQFPFNRAPIVVLKSEPTSPKYQDLLTQSTIYPSNRIADRPPTGPTSPRATNTATFSMFGPEDEV